MTYFLTIPFAALSIVALLRFREPQLHQSEHRVPLRRHLALTFRTLIRQRRLLPIISLAVLTALLVQTIFEFGPLWLVTLTVPAVLPSLLHAAWRPVRQGGSGGFFSNG